MNDLSLWILDLAQNSYDAHAKDVRIFITEDFIENQWMLEIIDDGDGITEEDLPKVFDPFFSKKQKRFGLGLPLFSDLCKECEGLLTLKSSSKKTILQGIMNLQSVNMLDLGKIEETITALICMNPMVELYYEHKTIRKTSLETKVNTFTLDTKEIRKELKELSIQSFVVLSWIKKYIKNGIEELKEGL